MSAPKIEACPYHPGATVPRNQAPRVVKWGGTAWVECAYCEARGPTQTPVMSWNIVARCVIASYEAGNAAAREAYQRGKRERAEAAREP